MYFSSCLASTSRAREDAVGAERALGDHALALAEQVGQDAAIDHRHRLLEVGDDEAHLLPVLLHAALLDQAADAQAPLGRRDASRAIWVGE